MIYKILLFSLIGESYETITIFYTPYYSFSEENPFAPFSSTLDLGGRVDAWLKKKNKKKKKDTIPHEISFVSGLEKLMRKEDQTLT